VLLDLKVRGRQEKRKRGEGSKGVSPVPARNCKATEGNQKGWEREESEGGKRGATTNNRMNKKEGCSIRWRDLHIKILLEVQVWRT